MQGSRSGQDDAHDHHDRGEGHGTQRVIRQSIQHLGSSQDMETNQQDVVSQQHEAGKDVCRLAFAEDIVAKVTYSGEDKLESASIFHHRGHRGEGERSY